jgi:ribosomal protein S12 methylthiotransferase
MAEAGWQITNDAENADLIVINTCAFIEAAREEAYTIIDQYLDFKKNGNCKSLVIAGCLTGYQGHELKEEFPEVDLFIGTGDVDRLPELVANIGERPKFTDRKGSFLAEDPIARILSTSPSFAYVKISEGCHRKCSFCTIPSIRGPMNCRSIASIEDEVRGLIDLEIPEIVLIGQDTTSYGHGMPGGRKNLVKLLERLIAIENLGWLRMLYCYPGNLPDRLFELFAEGLPLTRYIDIPLQHISDKILRSMKRGTSEIMTRQLIDRFRSEVAGVSLRTSLIVGYPGESENDFRKLYDFVEQTRFDRLGLFVYSAEPGTPAALLPDQIAEELKQERFEALATLQEQISLDKNKILIGSEITVLVDGHSAEAPGVLLGRTEFMAPEVDGAVIINGEAAAGDFCTVRITDTDAFHLYGTIIE